MDLINELPEWVIHPQTDLALLRSAATKLVAYLQGTYRSEILGYGPWLCSVATNRHIYPVGLLPAEIDTFIAALDLTLETAFGEGCRGETLEKLTEMHAGFYFRHVFEDCKHVRWAEASALRVRWLNQLLEKLNASAP